MTQYSNQVEEVRLRREAETWGEGIKYIHANNGVIETKYNNGNIHIKENWKGGKSWTVYAQEPTSTIDKFLRWKANHGK